MWPHEIENTSRRTYAIVNAGNYFFAPARSLFINSILYFQGQPLPGFICVFWLMITHVLCSDSSYVFCLFSLLSSFSYYFSRALPGCTRPGTKDTAQANLHIGNWLTSPSSPSRRIQVVIFRSRTPATHATAAFALQNFQHVCRACGSRFFLFFSFFIFQRHPETRQDKGLIILTFFFSL